MNNKDRRMWDICHALCHLLGDTVSDIYHCNIKFLKYDKDEQTVSVITGYDENGFEITGVTLDIRNCCDHEAMRRIIDGVYALEKHCELYQ